MTDDLSLPRTRRLPHNSPFGRRIAVRVALCLICTLAFFAATSLAPAAEVKTKPNPRPAEIQPQPKIEIVPDTRPIPKLSGHVNDTANVLKAEDREHIERALEQYERETFHQIAVLTIPTLAGEPIESYSLRIATAWKIGHKGIETACS
jgi:TPM domain